MIPLLAVPVSLVGTFAVFPLLGFSINTLSLFGLVLAIGLVVDDAIVVVEAVEQHIEHGLSPRDATLKAMEEVSGPVVAIALVLAAVFLPAAFVGGITGRLNNQFAVTIAISTLISAFNALTLSPALAALLLKPGKQSRGLLGWFFDRFNSGFGKVMHVYLVGSDVLLHKVVFSVLLLVVVALAAGFFGSRLPTGLLPEEDQGYFFLNVQLPTAASLQRTDDVAKKIEAILKDTPGVQTYNTVVGFSLLSFVNTTYNAFYFVTLKPWGERGCRIDRGRHHAESQPAARGQFPTRKYLGFHLRRFPASAPPAARHSCLKIDRDRALSSWRKTLIASFRRRASGRSLRR